MNDTDATTDAVARDDGDAGREALEAAVAENPEAVADFVERLDTVNDLLDVTDLATAAFDDEMVVRLARTGSSLGEVADTAAEPETVRGVEAMLRGVGEAGRDTPEPVGAVGLVRALRDPEVKRGLGFLLAVARGVGRELDDGSD